MKVKQKNILKASCQHREGLFADIILRNALFNPDREAFIYGDQRVTFKQYNERVNRLVHALGDMGIKKGDVLGVISWNCMAYMDLFGAAGKGGFIIAPFNTRLSVMEIEHLINDSQARVLFIGAEFADIVGPLKSNALKVRQFISLEGSSTGMVSYADATAGFPHSETEVEVNDEDPLFICYTSGTTGRPRGALYTNQRFRENTLCHVIEVPITSQDKGTSLMPLFHIGGIAIHAHLFYQAATEVITKLFDPKALMETIDKETITIIALVPTHLAAMLDLSDFDNYKVSSIKQIYYAGSPMPTELLKRGFKAFGSVFFQGYGQTESGPDISFLKEKDHDVLKNPREMGRLLSCGRPGLGVHVRIVDGDGHDVPEGHVGEIIVKSRQIMNEYWRKPEETKKTIVNGWLHTGDMGRYDADGYIYIVDRKHDMIVSGGENIYPREVEETLYRHAAVSECAVLGIPDPKWVEAVHAVVSLKKDTVVTPEELIEFCKENIARYKAPKSIEIVPEIPKSATGKILKKDMRKRYWDNPTGKK